MHAHMHSIAHTYINIYADPIEIIVPFKLLVHFYIFLFFRCGRDNPQNPKKVESQMPCSKSGED